MTSRNLERVARPGRRWRLACAPYELPCAPTEKPPDHTRGLDAAAVANGYKVTTPVRGAEEFTAIPVNFLWSIASGFAHGRPWAHHGLLHRETLNIEGHADVYLFRPRQELAVWLPLQAVHLLGELLRLRDRRAGRARSRMPDGFPDHEVRR